MAYTYRFYCFSSPTAFAAAWEAAGFFVDNGQPVLRNGAMDEIGPDMRENPKSGWFVNVAWPNGAPASLESFKIDPAEAMRVFAGWDDTGPLPIVPETITNFQARAILRSMPGVNPGKTLLEDADALVKSIGGVALDAWEYANDLERHSAIVLALAEQLNLSQVELDDLFIQASKITA